MGAWRVCVDWVCGEGCVERGCVEGGMEGVCGERGMWRGVCGEGVCGEGGVCGGGVWRGDMWRGGVWRGGMWRGCVEGVCGEGGCGEGVCGGGVWRGCVEGCSLVPRLSPRTATKNSNSLTVRRRRAGESLGTRLGGVCVEGCVQRSVCGGMCEGGEGSAN